MSYGGWIFRPTNFKRLEIAALGVTLSAFGLAGGHIAKELLFTERWYAPDNSRGADPRNRLFLHKSRFGNEIRYGESTQGTLGGIRFQISGERESRQVRVQTSFAEKEVRIFLEQNCDGFEVKKRIYNNENYVPDLEGELGKPAECLETGYLQKERGN